MTVVILKNLISIEVCIASQPVDKRENKNKGKIHFNTDIGRAYEIEIKKSKTITRKV